MNLNNAQTKEQIYQWNTIANAGSLAAAGGAFIAPPAALISGVSAAYFGQMASSAERHNNGNGIYIKVYWSQVFFIEPEVRLETGHSKLRQKKIQWYHVKFTEGVHDYG